MLHYPGDLNTQKMIEEGLLWSSKDGFIGESCLSYLYCKFAKLATLFGITTAEDNERERRRERERERELYNNLRNCSAFCDMRPIIASNKFGGIYNNGTIQDFAN